MTKSYRNLGRGRKANALRALRYDKVIKDRKIRENPRLVRFHFLHHDL